LLGVFFDPEDKRDVPPKRRVFSTLHGVTTHKTVIFIVTAVRTSNPKENYFKENIIVNKQSL
jgi:hypothetical protein